MKIAIQVPIKAVPSERVIGKNFRTIAGRPLFAWLLTELLELSFAPDIYVDSESTTTFDRVRAVFPEGIRFHQRSSWYAGNEANGNHLLNQFAVAQPAYDWYLQAFVTAPLLKAATIERAVKEATAGDAYDSFFTVTKETGFFWYQGLPINQSLEKMSGIPRTQDSQLVKETTGLYGINRQALLRTGCRIGARPLHVETSRVEALDIDTPDDFALAEQLLKARS
jgi:CMP-N-acetylneuraminic acid synthetase